ncbi:hypothetical protein GALL_289550 [mine drainage metagenome]|uniref:DUF2293 domain-containing protein n=1 Tax=mine drainage metagenome TaxID=410659 RepID=A0A1J5QZM0_9ZZZZ
MTAARRERLDRELRRLAPKLAEADRREIVAHALWSKGLARASVERAAWLSLISYVRHNFTEYDQMLRDDYPFEAARYFSLEKINTFLQEVGCPLRLEEEEKPLSD